MSIKAEPPRNAKSRSVRQSVTIPAALAAEVRRIAKERHVTMSHALVSLAERGVQAERDARAALKSAYARFMAEKEPRRKEDAGKDLIRAIFGQGSIGEDTLH